jgi:four helix bundle protein
MRIDDLEILQIAEQLSDKLWQEVVTWDHFAKDTVGKQLARSADSIGANIAEAFGRYHFGDRLRFLYFSRGSIYETKYWLNRAMNRDLLQAEDVQRYLANMTRLAKRLNTLVSATRKQQSSSKGIKEIQEEYTFNEELFSTEDLAYISRLETQAG